MTQARYTEAQMLAIGGTLKLHDQAGHQPIRRVYFRNTLDLMDLERCDSRTKKTHYYRDRRNGAVLSLEVGRPLKAAKVWWEDGQLHIPSLDAAHSRVTDEHCRYLQRIPPAIDQLVRYGYAIALGCGCAAGWVALYSHYCGTTSAPPAPAPFTGPVFDATHHRRKPASSGRRHTAPAPAANACGKIAYHTRDQANEAKRRTRYADGDRSRLNAYQCSDCDLWHIGHPYSAERRRRRNESARDYYRRRAGQRLTHARPARRPADSEEQQ